MELTKSKKGFSTGMMTGLIGVIITIIVIFNLVGNTAGTLTTAAGNISNSQLPLASLFASNGVVLLIFMAALLIGIAGYAFYAIKHKK